MLKFVSNFSADLGTLWCGVCKYWPNKCKSENLIRYIAIKTCLGIEPKSKQYLKEV